MASARSLRCASTAAAAALAAVANAAQKPSPSVREHVPAVTLDRVPHDRVVDPLGGGHLGRRLVPPAQGILDGGDTGTSLFPTVGGQAHQHLM